MRFYERLKSNFVHQNFTHRLISFPKPLKPKILLTISSRLTVFALRTVRCVQPVYNSYETSPSDLTGLEKLDKKQTENHLLLPKPVAKQFK